MNKRHNQPEKHFIEILSRRFLIIVNKLNDGYEVFSSKFDIYVFDKDMDKAIEQAKNLIEARVRLLLKDVVKVVSNEQGKR